MRGQARDWHTDGRTHRQTQATTIPEGQNWPRVKMQNKLARQIWEFAISLDLWLSAAHIPGAQNIEADEASRVFDDRTEWALRGDLFKIMCKIFGEPTIDLFASRLNHKVPRYCSWEPDPGAVFIDSFMYNWGTETLIYAFPPFSVIHMVVRKLIQDKAETSALVHIICKHTVRGTYCYRRHQWWTLPSFQETEGESAPAGGPAEDPGGSLQWRSLVEQGFSPKVIEVIHNCRRTSFNRLYETYIRKWGDYCNRIGSDPIFPSVQQVLNFLQSLREEPSTHRGYSALGTARSALSFFVIMPDNKPLGENKYVKQFMRGIFNLEPPVPRYSRVWDPTTVLNKTDVHAEIPSAA